MVPKYSNDTVRCVKARKIQGETGGLFHHHGGRWNVRSNFRVALMMPSTQRGHRGRVHNGLLLGRVDPADHTALGLLGVHNHDARVRVQLGCRAQKRIRPYFRS